MYLSLLIGEGYFQMIKNKSNKDFSGHKYTS